MIIKDNVNHSIKVVQGHRKISALSIEGRDSIEFCVESSKTNKSFTFCLSDEFIDMFRELIDEIQDCGGSL